MILQISNTNHCPRGDWVTVSVPKITFKLPLAPALLFLSVLLKIDSQCCPNFYAFRQLFRQPKIVSIPLVTSWMLICPSELSLCVMDCNELSIAALGPAHLLSILQQSELSLQGKPPRWAESVCREPHAPAAGIWEGRVVYTSNLAAPSPCRVKTWILPLNRLWARARTQKCPLLPTLFHISDLISHHSLLSSSS